MGLTRKEIEESAKITGGGAMTDDPRALADSGSIVEHYPFGMGRREPYYRLSGPFCRFYLRFVDGQESLGPLSG